MRFPRDIPVAPVRTTRTGRGVALVAVLSVLTILAILAMAYAVLTGIEQSSSTVSFHGMSAQALADAGLEHAKAVLWADGARAGNHYDSDDDTWRTVFDGRLARRAPEVDVDDVRNNGPRGDGNDAIWFPVRDGQRRLIGRYALLIQDECGKINLNAACTVPPGRANEGLSPREIMLGDGRAAGLPFSVSALTSLLNYKYGPNRVPGTRADDNHNNACLMADGLDNNANGIIDELDEGVNEPDEYTPHAPCGDDRALYSLQEAWRVLAPTVPASATRLAVLRQLGTLRSEDRNQRWDDAHDTWVPRVNVNVCGARDVLRALSQANHACPFGGNQRMLRRLATATVDYRDENTVLSTAGSEYGVEAVCFSEILANEGSRLMLPYYIREDYYGDRTVYSLPYFYSYYNYCNTEPVDDDNPAQRELVTSDKTTLFRIEKDSVKFIQGGAELQLEAIPVSGAGGYANTLRNFRRVLSRRGSNFVRGNRIQWPENIWRNSEVCLYKTASGAPEKTFQISRSTRDNRIFISDLKDVTPLIFTTTYFYAQIRSWVYDRGFYAERPQVHLWSVVPFLQPNLYYRVYIQETNLEMPLRSRYKNNLCTRLDVDGELSRGSEQELGRMRYRYRDGKAVRADSAGCIDVYLTSAKECSVRRRNRVNGYYCARPDIIELVNIGTQPRSLRGWSLVANTGSISYNLGLITHATAYLRDQHGRGVDDNPIIRPNEYFYLCNNMEIFDYEYGSRRNGVWGDASDEQMPVYEINDDTWGVRYRIRTLREVRGAEGWTTYVTCDNEHWNPNQFAGEVAEFQSPRKNRPGIATSPDGARYVIDDNTRNTLIFKNLRLQTYSAVQPGDEIMIVGLPRVGGLVSMTLKNEYGQIAARVIEYGNPNRDAAKNYTSWLNASVEKANPTREDWVFTRHPTFGGTVRKARNRAAALELGQHARIKNGPLASVGELRAPRALAAWEREDADHRSATTVKLLQGAAEYMDTMGMRLDAEEPGAHLAGWQPAFGEATIADTRAIFDHNAQWDANCWSNQSVTILSGKNRGETFAVVGNTRTRLMIAGRSVPSRATFFVRSGDQYALGPGYASAFYYTRRAGDAGEWEWKDKRIPPGTYQLYLVGLNDAIRTTEFLEENHNARLDVYLYNFRTGAYDELGRNLQYDKSDTVFAGLLQPQHLSSSGGVRLKLIPKQIRGQYASGFAWFDYAFLTPVPVAGRININTASPRILMTLGPVSAALAQDIAGGINSAGEPKLKPYRSIGEVLLVRGMTPDVFSRIANLITVRSDQFTVYVTAQRLFDVNNDGQFRAGDGDRVCAQVRLRAMLDRGSLYSPAPTHPAHIRVFDRERY